MLEGKHVPYLAGMFVMILHTNMSFKSQMYRLSHVIDHLKEKKLFGLVSVTFFKFNCMSYNDISIPCGNSKIGKCDFLRCFFGGN